MKYLMINGSPRHQLSNSSQIIENIINGMQISSNCIVETMSLRTEKDRFRCAEIVPSFSHVLLVFPLYTDAMPGIVMDFIEKLSPHQGKLNHIYIGFIVHSGFPETRHCLAIKQYLDRLPVLLSAKPMGCIKFGGSMTLDDDRKETLMRLGQALPQDHYLHPKYAKQLVRFDHIPIYMIPLFKIIIKSKRMQSYWIDQLKMNDAYERRNDRPYA